MAHSGLHDMSPPCGRADLSLGRSLSSRLGFVQNALGRTGAGSTADGMSMSDAGEPTVGMNSTRPLLELTGTGPGVDAWEPSCDRETALRRPQVDDCGRNQNGKECQ